MSLSQLPLRVPPVSAEGPEAAFAELFAISLGDLHLAQGGAAQDRDSVIAAAQRACQAVQQGHACADLLEDANDAEVHIDLAVLRRSPVIGDGGVLTPLVLVQTRLYLHRYWRYERSLAQCLSALNRPVDNFDAEAAAAALDALFPVRESAGIDWQKVAAATALARHLSIVSGGPGTGKTTTVVRMLAALLRLQGGLRIAIAAPTGKAAARLKASIDAQVSKLDLPPSLSAQLPAQAHTVHRLLGYRPNRAGFRHDATHRLPFDVVVIDEASMLDLALASKLVAALPPQARLILLGDKDQLASVEAGGVYAELSARAELDEPGRALIERVSGIAGLAVTAELQPMANAVVWLDRAWRFADQGGIARLAAAVNNGDAARVREVLAAESSSLRWHAQLPAAAVLAANLASGFDDYVQAVRSGAAPVDVLRCFERYRVLCSTRAGVHGSETLNRHLAQQLQRRMAGSATAARWYAGRAVIVEGNDYALQLFNGDIGVALPDEQGRLRVYFAGDPEPRAFAPGRLASVSSAFALTVHKAQGSEFDRVDLVVEPALARGLSRELLYTAVTRARQRVGLWCTGERLDAMVSTRLRRRSSIIG